MESACDLASGIEAGNNTALSIQHTGLGINLHAAHRMVDLGSGRGGIIGAVVFNDRCAIKDRATKELVNTGGAGLIELFLPWR